MKKRIKSIIPLALTVSVLSGCSFILDFFKEDKPGNVDSYYGNIDLTLNNYNLFEDLHKLMWDTHVNNVLYSKYSSYQKKTDDYDDIDRVPGTNKRQLFYSGVYSTSNGTREHVWPCAKSKGLWEHNTTGEGYVDGSGYWGGGSDLFHVRPANTAINTLRGDSVFVDFDDPLFSGVEVLSANYETSGGKAVKFSEASFNGSKYTYAKKVEVDDSMKGDVARILAYVYLHYSKCSTTPSNRVSKTASLAFKSVLGYESESDCMDKLIEWNELDPVSDIERLRNDNVQRIQGNRNPFVDFEDDLMYNVFAYRRN